MVMLKRGLFDGPEEDSGSREKGGYVRFGDVKMV